MIELNSYDMTYINGGTNNLFMRLVGLLSKYAKWIRI